MGVPSERRMMKSPSPMSLFGKVIVPRTMSVHDVSPSGIRKRMTYGTPAAIRRATSSAGSRWETVRSAGDDSCDKAKREEKKGPARTRAPRFQNGKGGIRTLDTV